MSALWTTRSASCGLYYRTLVPVAGDGWLTSQDGLIGFTGWFPNRLPVWETGSLWRNSPCSGATVASMTVEGRHRICDDAILDVSLVGCVFA